MNDKKGTSPPRELAASNFADSEDFVRLLLNSTGEGIFGVDLDGNCTFANPACAKLLGFKSVDELLGQHMHKLVHHTRANGEPYPVEECRIYQAYHRNEGTHVDDEVMFCADGNPFPAEYWSYPVNRDGELVGCVVTFVDITERQRNEELRAEHAATLAEVARLPEMNPGPVLRVDQDWIVRLANTAARSVFGDDVVGRCWREILPDFDEICWQGILDATEPVALEQRVGERHYVFVHRRDFEGDLVFVFGADITDQKQADEQVRLLLNSTGEGIYGVDLDGNCTFANPACAKLLGFKSVDELLGQHMHKLVHHTRANGEPYPVEECRIYQAYHRNEGTHVDDEVMFCADGNPFPTEYWSYPVNRDGELVGCVVTFVDITERQRVEEELRQTEKMAALGKLSAGLAHELNNPAAAAGRAADQLEEGINDLQSVTIELAQTGMEPGTWKVLTDRLSEFRQRSASLTDLTPLEATDREEELLGYLDERGVAESWAIAPVFVASGIEAKDLDAIAAELTTAPLPLVMLWMCRAIIAGDLTGVVERSTRSISELVNVVKSYSYMDRAPSLYVDIHDGIEDTIVIMGHKLKRGIEVVREYDRDLPQVKAQGSELNQVWTNLLDNAIGAMNGKGTLKIRTYREDDQVTVKIADSGPGIPDEIQHRIFEPFFTTKDVGEGTGLGLDVVSRIVTNRCGGRIDFETGSNGTTFRVRLPVDIASDAADQSNLESRV